MKTEDAKELLEIASQLATIATLLLMIAQERSKKPRKRKPGKTKRKRS